MSEKKRRKAYSAEFKAKIGLEALRNDLTLNELGQKYEVHPKLIGEWKQEIQNQAKDLFEGKRGTKPAKSGGESVDTERLYSEIGKLTMSLDWLKKKSGMNP